MGGEKPTLPTGTARRGKRCLSPITLTSAGAALVRGKNKKVKKKKKKHLPSYINMCVEKQGLNGHKNE